MGDFKNSLTHCLFSFAFLLLALGVAFGVMLNFAPSSQEKPSLGLTKQEDHPSLATKTQRRSKASWRFVSNDSFANADEKEVYEHAYLQDASGPKADASQHTASLAASPDQVLAGPSATSAKEVEALLSDAMRQVDQGNPQAALENLTKILKLDPKNEMALVEMGMLQLIDLKNPQQASHYLQQALQINPNNRVVLSELLGIYEELGQQQNGLAYLQTLYDEYPDNGALAMGLGQMLASQNRLNEALPYLEKAAEDQKSGLGLADLADAYSQAGQRDKALDTYQRVIDFEQDRLDSGFYAQNPQSGKENLAMAYMDKIAELVQQKRFQEAEEILESKVKHIVGGNIKEVAKLLDKSREIHKR